ncbi:MAG: hypothetical protein ACJA01_003986 [Saprospiraceae bacterium]|jgi:hypothetical protein
MVLMKFLTKCKRKKIALGLGFDRKQDKADISRKNKNNSL